MGLFRRRAQKGSEEDQEPRIQEVEDAAKVSRSTSQPMIEEPDEEGNYPARYHESRQPESGFHPSTQSPFDAFFGEPMLGGFGGFGHMAPFGGSPFGQGFFGRDPFGQDTFSNMHAHMQSQLFGMGGMQPGRLMDLPMLMGNESFVQRHNASDRAQGESEYQNKGGDRLQPRNDQFAYQFHTYSSMGGGQGERIERHFSARGSTDDNMHHVREAVRSRDGRVQSRQESIPFDRRQPREQRPAITYE